MKTRKTLAPAYLPTLLRTFSLAVLIVVPLSASAFLGQTSPEEQREKLSSARDAALSTLFELQPSAKAELENAKGFAVFSNIGINVLLVSTQRGGGILHDNRSGEETYMKMFSAGGGWGMGVKDFSAVFVFDTDEAIDQFVEEGWDFSAQADANLHNESEGAGVGAAMTMMPGTRVYQITDSGVALQATLQGSKFWADKDLNEN
ncbi:MAG: lipid-binding SYLF domain-containing protein [Halieaceae bacterium]|jgi:lipid-binding SYLF domain-containing protein